MSVWQLIQEVQTNTGNDPRNPSFGAQLIAAALLKLAAAIQESKA